MQAKAYQRALLVLVALLTATPAFSAGVVVQDQDEYREAVTNARPGDVIRLRVLAQDVMLSRTRPEGLSALNILPVRINHVHRGGGPGVALRLSAGADHLLARITARALAQMALSEGTECFAILKASSVAPSAISGAQTAHP